MMLDSDPLALCYENVMSSTKPELLNVLQRHHRSNEPWPEVTCTKFGADVFELCEQTDTQEADILITILCEVISAGVTQY